MILKILLPAKKPFLSSWAQKCRGITKTVFTDLLVKVRHGLQLPGQICWDQTEKSSCVSLSPAASPLRSTGTTHHLSLPPAQSTDCSSGEHCQLTTALGRFRLFQKWRCSVVQSKTLVMGTLSPKPKWKRLDWTNGRLWWFTTTHLKNVEDVFGIYSNCKASSPKFFHLKQTQDDFFLTAVMMSCAVRAHTVREIRAIKVSLHFQDMTRDFNSVIRCNLEILCWKLQEAFSITLGRREIAFCEGLCAGNARLSYNHRTGDLCCHRLWKSWGSSDYSESKSLPLVGKGFSAMELNRKCFPSSTSKDCNNNDPRIRSLELHTVLTLQCIFK